MKSDSGLSQISVATIFIIFLDTREIRHCCLIFFLVSYFIFLLVSTALCVFLPYFAFCARFLSLP